MNRILKLILLPVCAALPAAAADDGKLNAQGKAYGDLIREYRKRRNLSQKELGEILHVTKNAVGAWESGRSHPDLADIPTLCRELEMPIEVFFGMPESPVPDQVTEKYSRLNEYHRTIVMRQMETLYDLQKQS